MGSGHVRSQTRSRRSQDSDIAARSEEPPWRRHAWLLALALIVPVGAGGIALLGRFDGLYGQDAYTYFDYAVGPLRHSVAHFHLPPPFFWPVGYPFAVTIASFAVGRVALAGQLVSLVAGASVPVSTALLARELWRPPEHDSSRRAPLLRAPFIAGVLAAFAGQLWQSSVVVMSDTLALALATAGVAALARYARKADGVWLVAAAALLAGAVATRWVYAIVALPCVICALYVVADGVRASGRRIGHAAAAAVVAAAVLAPIVARPLVHGGGADAFTGSFGIHHWSAARMFERHFVTDDGILSYSLPTGLYYALAPASWVFFTPLLAPLIFVGAWAVFRRPSAARVLLLPGWVAVVYLFHAGAAYQGFRFGLAYLPPLAILAGIGAERVADAIATRRFLALSACALFVCGLALMAFGGVRLTRDLIERKNDGLDVMRWTEDEAPPDARLVTFTLTLTFRHYSRLETFELFEQTPSSLRRLVRGTRPLLLLVDVPDVRTQWQGRAPANNLRWLDRHTKLTPLGTHAGFTLFAVAR